MKKNFTVIIAAALVLVGVIVAVIIVGLSLPERPETIQGEAETTDYRLWIQAAVYFLLACWIYKREEGKVLKRKSEEGRIKMKNLNTTYYDKV